MKVLAVFGTRPEAIKLAPVIREMRRRSVDAGLRPVVCVTAQHRQMLDQVLRLFDIRPDHDLDLMRDGQSPSQVAAAVLTGLESILRTEEPDWVLVQGDTTTVASAALAAFYARLKVGHVEAGLRTFDKWQPFPEETNRRVASAIADLHFAPTGTARRNLVEEGVPGDRVLVTGNPVIDAVRWVAGLPPGPESESWIAPFLGAAGTEAGERRLILVTAHRRENFGRPLENICAALRDIAASYRGRVSIVYPVHLNPQVWGPVHRMLDGVPGISLIPPLDYLPLVQLLRASVLVLTDSGGIQEEAPGLGRPVLVLREVTERPEAVAAGTVRLVGTDRSRIVAETSRLLDDAGQLARMSRAVNPYGDGHASERIVAALLGEAPEPFASTALPAEGEGLAVRTPGAMGGHLDGKDVTS